MRAIVSFIVLVSHCTVPLEDGRTFSVFTAECVLFMQLAAGAKEIAVFGAASETFSR